MKKKILSVDKCLDLLHAAGYPRTTEQAHYLAGEPLP